MAWVAGLGLAVDAVVQVRLPARLVPASSADPREPHEFLRVGDVVAGEGDSAEPLSSSDHERRFRHGRHVPLRWRVCGHPHALIQLHLLEMTHKYSYTS